MTDKKKILGPWITLIIVIIGIGIGIGVLIHQDQVNKYEMKIYQEVDIFIQIDDIAHQEINESRAENPFTTKELKDEFYEIDDEYHDTEDIEKKYIATKKMVDLLEEVEENRPVVTGDAETDLEKDNEYRELIEQFNEIR